MYIPVHVHVCWIALCVLLSWESLGLFVLCTECQYLTLGACTGGLQYLVGVCVCVRLSVCLFAWTISAIARNKTPKKRHHKNMCPMVEILEKTF